MLDVGADRREAEERLLAIPGVGPWTVGHVALRSLGDPDAFPAGDLGLQLAATRLGLADHAVGLARRAKSPQDLLALAAAQTPAPLRN